MLYPLCQSVEELLNLLFRLTQVLLFRGVNVLDGLHGAVVGIGQVTDVAMDGVLGRPGIGLRHDGIALMVIDVGFGRRDLSGKHL